MEARQFYTRSLSPLVTRTFAIKWSEDGKLSVVSKEGVHVFEIIPAPSQSNPILNIYRSFIQSPGTLPCQRYSEDLLNQMFEWEKEDIYSFLMTDAYTPNFPKTSKPITEICDVFWSPRDLLHPHGCLIALLTSCGGMDIAVQIGRNWFTIYNVSDAWADIIEDDYLNLKNSNDNLDPQTMRNQMDRMFATCVTWSCVYRSNKSNDCFAYIVSAHRNSEISIWSVDQVMSDTIRDHLSAKLEHKFNRKLIDENVKISALLWINLSKKHCLIIVGFFNGLVGVLKLERSKTKLKFDSYSNCYEEEDRISVDSLHVWRTTDKWLELVIIKGMHLVTLVIDIYGKMISMKHVCSPGFSITGSSIINSDMIVITTQDGQFCEVRKSLDQQELICTPVKIDVYNSSLQYLGLASSPNRVLFTLITSPNVMFDHLIDREPSTVFFFHLNNVPTLNPLDIIFSKDQSLRKCWDCLELVKINAVKYNETPSNLVKLTTNLELMSPHELRAAHWIMTLIQAMLKKNGSDKVSNYSAEINKSHSYLFLHSAYEYLNLLAQCNNLTEKQRLSASLLKTHLDIWLAGEEEDEKASINALVQRVKYTLKFIKDSIEPETCNLCNELIIEPWSQTCPTGHKLSRCAITQLQVTCAKFRSCLVCKEIFHPCLDEEKLIAEVRCPYCDLPAYFKNEVDNELLNASPKNLSKKPLSDSKKNNNDSEKI